MNRDHLSIALCTYNGARYLSGQLHSIADQTRLPDELVVCDDGSTDGTVDIIKEFTESAPFPVRLCINETNLGSRKNFEQAIGLCHGQLIACSDQDDIWYPTKLETCEKALGSSTIGLVFSDADVVSEDLTPLGYRLSQPVGIEKKSREILSQGRAMEILASGNIVTGTTMMFKTKWRDLVLPIPEDGERIHDGWIALLIAAVDGIRYLNEPLLAYRQHDRQEIGLRAFTLPPDVDGQYQGQIASLRCAAQVLETWRVEQGVSPPGLANIYLGLACLTAGWRSTESRGLRARAVEIDPSVRLHRGWKYNLASSLLGITGAEQLAKARRRFRRWWRLRGAVPRRQAA